VHDVELDCLPERVSVFCDRGEIHGDPRRLKVTSPQPFGLVANDRFGGDANIALSVQRRLWHGPVLPKVTAVSALRRF
jgi:hypothetical protein